MTDWKSKTKGRAAEIEKNLKQTGGGIGTNATVSNLEKRLLILMGKKSYKGDESVREMGFELSSKVSPSISKIKEINLETHRKTIKFDSVEDLSNREEPTPNVNEVLLCENTDNCEEHNYSFNETQEKNKSVSTQRCQKIVNLSEDIRKINDQTFLFCVKLIII